MNMNQNKPMNKRLEKLAVENTAFNNCRDGSTSLPQRS